jgi:hypothetical protein
VHDELADGDVRRDLGDCAVDRDLHRPTERY